MRFRFGVLGLLLAAALAATPLACIGSDGDTSMLPPPDATSPPTSTATPRGPESLADEVLRAYMAYWDAYSLALLHLDEVHVEPVAAGEELERIREEVEILRSQGVALRVVVQHKPAVIEVAEGSALIFDAIVNNSFYVDPRTKEPPVASGSGETLRESFYLEHVEGYWKVVRRTRQR